MPWPAARRCAYDHVTALPARELPLHAALGTTLAAPLTARSALPAFDTAAMDGYAIAGGGPWRVVDTVLAGAPCPAPLAPGEAVEIATGAAVPVGADAVLPYEQTASVQSCVTGPVVLGRHIRRRGEECATGTALLPAGAPVTAMLLGLAAATGHDALLVRPRPRVLALVTGAELLSAGQPGDGRVRDAIGPMLPGLVAALGGELVAVRRIGDEAGALAEALAGADADVVVTSGSCSVGPVDHLHAALAARGARLLVDGVACRPGHPQLLAVGQRPVVGLPGNPLAALVGALTLLGPLLAALTGRSLPALEHAVLAKPLAQRGDDTRLVPVRREGDLVLSVDHAGSAMLRGAAAADAVAVVPPTQRSCERDAYLPAGAVVELVEVPR